MSPRLDDSTHPDATPSHIRCKFCGYRGKPRIQWRGQKWVAQLLWLTLLIPGPLYNFWQWQGRKRVCPQCESENIVPDDGNDRYELLKKLEKDLGDDSF